MADTHCSHCKRTVDVEFGTALVPSEFMLYDSTADREIPIMDSCEKYDCPHDKSVVKFSRMLPPMGSMGEEAPNSHPWDEADGLQF